MEQFVPQHKQLEKAEEYVIFPEHDIRRDSKEYLQNRHHLIHELGLPCFVCMMKSGGYKDKNKVPTEAYQKLETHHFVVEWAAWHAVEPEAVQYLFDNGFYDFYGFSAKLKGTPVLSPDDIRNLVVLCQAHHRDQHIGIHHSTFPEYSSNMVAKEGIDILLTKEEWIAVQTGKATITPEGDLKYKQ